MREILFKAKRLDNGEWVEGDLIQAGEKRYIAFGWEIDNEGEQYYNFDCALVYEVDPSTVCRYTGLTDKNGVNIWEGDKLRGWFYYYKNTECYASFQDGAFGIVWMRGKIKEFTAFTSICNVVFEVVGNIYDQEDQE